MRKRKDYMSKVRNGDEGKERRRIDGVVVEKRCFTIRSITCRNRLI